MSTPPDDPTDPRELSGYDLQTWQVPPPPAGMTDRVLARMQAPLLPAHVGQRTRSARTISAVAGATLVAAAAVAALMMTHHDATPIVASQTPVTSPAVAPPSPHPTPTPNVQAGTPADDARVQALEKRVLELEVTVEELRTQLTQVRPPSPSLTFLPQPTPIPQRPSPTPLVIPPDENSLLPNERTRCDPFVHPHGCSMPTPPRACDFDALVKTGSDAVDIANYAVALDAYESALVCQPDSTRALKLAFLAACKSLSATKARMFYAQMDAATRAMMSNICVREGIDPAMPADAATGTVVVKSTPTAKILIDGIDTKRSTPASISVPVGKHKITLEIGGDKYTYTIIARAGETTAFTKDLQ